jgi:hypothetical protein
MMAIRRADEAVRWVALVDMMVNTHQGGSACAT